MSSHLERSAARMDKIIHNSTFTKILKREAKQKRETEAGEILRLKTEINCTLETIQAALTTWG